MSASTVSRQITRLVLIAAVAGIAAWGTRGHWQPLLANATTTDSGSSSTRAAPAKSAHTVPVIVDAVGETADDVTIEAIGTARAAKAITLYPVADGRITEMPVTSGQRVEKDAMILKLDDRAAVLAVRVADTHIRDAERALERSRKLKKSNVRSTANVEDAEVALERARLERFQAGKALSDRTLRAPFAGILGIPSVEAGDRIDPETPIATLDDRQTLLVEFEVAERYLSRLEEGMPLEATTPAFQDRIIPGRVDRIDSRVDPVSRTVLVRAAFENSADRLRPGMSFEITLHLPGAILPSVPQLALQWQDGHSYVWRIRNGVSERVEVSARRRLNDRVIIEGALEPGELIAIEGVQRLRDGRAVEITGGGDDG